MPQRTVPTDEVVAIGGRIRRIRESRNITQRELAQRLKVHASTVSDLERGRGISLRMYRDIALTLGCSWDEMLGVPGDPNGVERDSPRYDAGYRSGVADSIGAVRSLLQRHDHEQRE